MIDQVIERRDEGDGRERRMMRGDEHHAGAEAGNDDADVFDGAVRQHRLEIVVGGGVENSDQRRSSAHDECEEARPRLRGGHQIGVDTQDAVEPKV